MNQKSDIETIEEAAAILDGEALALRECSTIGPDNNDWTGEDDALATYQHWKQIVERLYALAERMGKAS
jgi:hypothetical protein